MTNTMTIRVLPAQQSREQIARRRTRRRKAIANTLLEAFATVGLGVCFILCAVLIVCVV